MKDMTEKEARAALKKAMPWARTVRVYEADPAFNKHEAAAAYVDAPCVHISAEAATLRTAVRRCIAAAKKVGAAK